MVRIATFNAENLFARYRFRENINPMTVDGFTRNDLAFDINDETSKQITAEAIIEMKADIVALQEVESLPVVDRFNSQYLAKMKYKHRIVVDSFDPRGIDVAILSRAPIENIKTHRSERNRENTGFLFSRDCLEVEIRQDGKLLVLYVNHFKSMIGRSTTDGRSETKARREEQAQRVAQIIDQRWAPNYKGNFVVLGDFNDYIDDDTSLGALIDHAGLANISSRIPEKDRWTHYWAGGNAYRQLDFILLSKELAENNDNRPEIMRKGLPYRAELYTGKRFDHVGENHPKASDHCPIFVDLKLV
jgi:predicted extracellular nuclease